MALNDASSRSLPRAPVSRRTLLRTGLLGAAALSGAAWWAGQRTPFATLPVPAANLPLRLTADDRAFLAAIASVVLPQAPREAVVDAAQEAIAQLAPAAQGELKDLFALMALRPARGALTGVWSAWSAATPEALSAFVERWRTSRLALLQSAYHALHDIVLGAWYAQDHTWQALGYPGPPQLPGLSAPPRSQS